MKYLITLFFLFLSILIYGQLSVQIDTILLGQKKIFLYQYEQNYHSSMPVFVHVHENETASLKAGLDYIKQYGGKVITIRHSEDNAYNRMVNFQHKKNRYTFDPNRIFSENKSILNKTITGSDHTELSYDEVVVMIDRLAQIIWEKIASAPMIIALHNNKNECASCVRKGWFGRKLIEESYNITSYVQKCDVKNESTQSCDAIYINPSINNSEFFIVTSPKDFDTISKKRFNAVLQNQAPVDDGSMSVYAQTKGKRYVNVEAKHGRSKEQYEMIKLLMTIDKNE